LTRRSKPDHAPPALAGKGATTAHLDKTRQYLRTEMPLSPRDREPES